MKSAQPATELNVAQKRAASHGTVRSDRKGVTAGPMLVVAGAGTGKTSTIAHRMAHLLVNGVDPARILLLTFTRRAAQEMRRRAQEVVKQTMGDTLGTKAQSLLQRLTWAGTFHSIGNRLLRHYAKHLKLDANFTVMDRSDSADLLDSLREELKFTEQFQHFPRKDACLAIYSWRVNTQQSLQATLEKQFPWFKNWETELTQLFRLYVQRKQQYRMLDYDDLLLYWHAMMKNTQLAALVGGNFDHVLVDEYQDTNKLQGDILKAMKPDGSGVTVAGDDAQSICSFRAASVENILNFPQQYEPAATVVTLAQNYRSTQPVLDSANALMVEAPRQHRKTLLSVRGHGAMPVCVTTEDLVSQAEYVCTEVQRRREAGVSLRSQAVLFRNSSASDALEVELSRRKIPFVKYGGLQFLEARHVKDMLALLRWADNPLNALAAFRVLQLVPGMGPVNARKALALTEAQSGSALALAGFQPPTEAKLVFQRLYKLLGSLQDPKLPWDGQLRAVREWYQPQMERLYDHVHTRVGDLDQIEQLAAQYPTRERFLTEMTLDPPQAADDLAAAPHLDEDHLVLSTVHSAKGMEWNTVYVLNVVEGSFPSEFSAGKTDLIEEERRLLYVAMTRAKDELQLCVPLKFPTTKQAPTGDKQVYGAHSRFMSSKVLKTLKEGVYHGSSYKGDQLSSEDSATLDVSNTLRDMW